MEIKEFLPYLSVPSLIGAIVLIIRIVALARTTKIERLLMNDQKNIVIFLIQSFFASIITAIIALYFTSLAAGDEQIEFYVALFLVYFVLAFASVPGVYSVLSLIKKRSIHYVLIDSEVVTDSMAPINPPVGSQYKIKLYIHRVTIEDKVIVSNKPTLNDIQGFKRVIDKSFLYDKDIFEEKL
ncbi:hypothetical protein [Paenibacillus amylolyticus]|uniref:Uncharacterized protein n=2 Tax=Paenibacillus TaxID=44249 RepID=A0A117I0U7_PAEAM|nr:hypothetical protein [Paenibacillus amylolyticus]GAS81167.1 unknown protein [Paenibacillus amylolyticus]